MVGPALFYERDEEGAGFFGGFEAEGVEGVGVGVGLDGGGGGEDEDVGVQWWFGRDAGFFASLKMTSSLMLKILVG